MVGPVETRELQIFFVLARELHFGRTAQRLRLSQARVSQAIRSLETTVGASLFARTSRHVELTSAGRELLERTEPAYRALQDGVEAVRRAAAVGLNGVIRLGLPNQVSGGPRLLEIVQRFREANPGCEVRFVQQSLTEDPLQQLRGGEVDLAAMRLPLHQSDLHIGPVLSREGRVLLVAESDQLATRPWIDYDEVGERRVSRNEAFPTETMDAFIPPVTPSGRVLRRISNETIEQLMLRVALGEQVHPTVSSWLAQHPAHGVVAVPIRDLPPSETALVRLKAVRSPRVQAFLAAAEAVLAT